MSYHSRLYPAASHCLSEPLEPRTLLHAGHEHFVASINFQPATSPVPAGYLVDAGHAYAVRANGLTYGWNASRTDQTRDRNHAASPDQRYDTLIKMGSSSKWEIAVPNGTYSVHIVAGDPHDLDNVYKLNVENVPAISGTGSTTTRWFENTLTVSVTDGRLTINGVTGAVGNTLAFLDIAQLDETTTEPPPPPPPPPTTAPAAPSSALATGTGTTSARMTWVDNSNNETGFQIWRKVGDNGVWYRVDTVAANTTTFTDTGLAANTRFLYRVRAVNGAGSSAYSNSDSATTFNDRVGNKITWSTRANAPIVRSEALRAVVDGKLYTFGGFSGSLGLVARSDVYDPATNTWQRIADMPRRLTHAGVAVVGRDVYVAGGYVGTGSGYTQQFGTREVWRYNVDANQWFAMPPLPAALASGGLVALGGDLHYFGGNDANRQDVGVHYVLDLANQAAGWISAVALPSSRSHLGYVELGGKVYAVGGQFGNDAGLTTTALVHVWDPSNPGVWTQLASMPAPLSHISGSTFILNGRIVVAGGETQHGSAINYVFAYDPLTNSWSSMTNLPANRMSAVAGVIGGEIYFTGGSNQVTTYRGVITG